MTPPLIDSLTKAIDIGTAISEVCRFDRDWAEAVYTGGHTTWRTGPDVLNQELQSMFSGMLTKDEQRRILARYTALRLSR